MSVVYKKGPWSTAEDAQLLHLIQITGPAQWVKISLQMGTRSAKQCRERYHQNLKPTLRHDPITAEEGRIIEQLVEQMGKRWADIARKLNNRSDNHVKNWWNSNNSHQKRPKTGRASPRILRDPAEEYRYGSTSQPLLTPSEYVTYPHHHHHSDSNNINNNNNNNNNNHNHHHHQPHQSHHRHHHHGVPPSPTSFGKVPYQQPAAWNAHSGLPSPSTGPVGGEALDRVPSLMSDAGSVHSTSPRSVAMPSTPDSPPILPPLKMDEPGGAPWEPRLAFRGGGKSAAQQVTLPPLRHAMGHHQLPTAPSSPTDVRPGTFPPPPQQQHHHHHRHHHDRHHHYGSRETSMATQYQLPSLSDAIRYQAAPAPGSTYGYISRTSYGMRTPL